MLTAVTGINWGDEGKGRVIDLLAEHADIVVRYQGGNNAGHTVVNKQGKFVLNLLPSGILHPDVVCVLGDGMADENILAMRQLCRYRDSVISSRTEIKLRIGTIMEQIFPEYEKQFSSLWVSTSMGILEKYLTPENIENAPIDELFEIIKDKSHNRLTRAKAISIKEAAADTFGIKIAQDAFSFQLKQLIDRMNFLDKQIEALDCQILEYYEKFDCYLHTIPGIGIIGAATILAEIGDISRFKNSSSLIAFAGIDPTVRQSGEFNSTHNHMSKRGSPYLRHAIFLAATTCSFHNSPLNAYYKKKRDQGKHHLTATGAVARKLTTVIYAVLRDSKPYEPKKFC